MILLSNKSEMKLHWIVTMLVCGLKVFGLAPFSYRISTSFKNSGESWLLRGFRSSKIGMAYNTLFFILYQVMTLSALPSTLSRLEYTGFDDQIKLLGLIVRCLATNVVIISCTLRRNKAISVMNRLLEVDRLLSGTEDNSPYDKAMFAFLALHMIFNASSWTVYLYQSALDSDQILNWSWEIISTFVVYWLIVEYSAVLGLLAGELGRDNNNLLKLKEFPHNLSPESFIGEFNSSTKSQLDPLELFITIRTTLYEVSRDVSEFFSWPILLSVSCCFYVFITWICDIVKRLSDATIVINSYQEEYIFFLSRMVIAAYPVLLLCLNVSKAANEAKLTRQIIQKLLATVKRPDIKAELQEFLLQLLHEDLTYTAHGIFTLDSTILLSVNMKRIVEKGQKNWISLRPGINVTISHTRSTLNYSSTNEDTEKILGSSIAYVIIIFSSDS